MMNQLIPCPGCHRHVRQAETSCPFCGGALSLSHVPEHVLPRSRLGRAATFAFGATLVGATTLLACGGESEEGKKESSGGTSSDAGTSAGGTSSGGSSAGSQASGGTGIGPVYGAPAGGIGNESGTGNSAGTSSAGSNVGGSAGPAPAYGAPAAGFSGVPVYGAAPAD